MGEGRREGREKGRAGGEGGGEFGRVEVRKLLIVMAYCSVA